MPPMFVRERNPDLPLQRVALVAASLSLMCINLTRVYFVQLKQLFEYSLFIALPAKGSVIVVDPVKSALGRAKEDIIGRIKTNVRK
jgi:hypothetical protein